MAVAVISVMIGQVLAWPHVTEAAAAFSFDISGETTDPVDIAYSLDTGHYYVVDNADTLVYEYDDSGNYVGVFIDPSVDGASNIASIDYSENDEIFYVLDGSQATLYLYDSTGSYLGQYDVSGMDVPVQVASDNSTHTLLLTSITIGSSTIYELDDGDGTPTGTSFDVTTAATGWPTGMTYGGGYIWIINDTDWEIVQLDRNTGAPTGFTIDISGEGGGNPQGLDYFALSSGYLFFIDSGTVYIYQIPGGVSGEVDDDSYLDAGVWWSVAAGDSLNLWQGVYAGTYYIEIAVRFPGVAVAPGATITSATLRLVSGGSGTTGSFGTLYGSDIDNAPAWSTLVYPDAVTKTTASTPFVVTNATAAATQDFDVTDIVQEIVNRPGWQSGNALAFAGDSTGTDIAGANFGASEAGPSYAPQLIIETSGGGGGDPPARELRLQGGVRLMNGVRLY